MEKTVSIVVSGKVQGVFFRQSTREMATQFGVTGVVKNEEDGSVRIVVSGDEQAIGKLVDWCRKGPSRARVTDVRVEEKEQQRFADFRIER
jgi:acylphosphatase